MVNIVNVALRAVEFFFAIVILGLSANLVKTQAYGGAPSITNYEVFLGIWLVVISLLGIAGDFIGALGGVVMVALDGLSILFTFAGGVVSFAFAFPFPPPQLNMLVPLGDKVADGEHEQGMAAALGAHSCSCNNANKNCPYLVNNVVINGGKNKDHQVNLHTNRSYRCREAQADTAFIWFAFAAFVATFALSFLSWRRGGIK